ncbi:MAG TPA: 50S ribosomal protein L10 [Fimbriimonadaceae bacterium]|nr:50S ribosomal protein L10 [Fimbriimonadaceae bacterium]
MPTAEKVKQVAQMKERYERASGVIFTEYRGLSVPAMQQLRRNLTEQGAEFSVVKNTLFKIAAGDDAEKIGDELMSGPTAVAFIYNDEAAIAKALFDFIKDHKSFVVKGGFIDGTLYDGSRMEELSKLPPREVLLSQIVGLIAAPMSNIASVIQEIYAAPIRAIGAVADKAAEGGTTEAAEAAPAPEPEPEPVPESEPTPTAEAEPQAEAMTEPIPEAVQE